MILHPGIIALLTASSITGILVIFAATKGMGIARNWNPASGSDRQIRLERSTCLVSTLLACAMAIEVLTLFLFVHTADGLSSYLSGAMCAAGSLNANQWGYPLLVIKTVNCIAAAVWLIVNHADSSARDYPLIRLKYSMLLAATPLFIAETALMIAYFAGLQPEVMISCCGSLFNAEGSGIAADLASLPPRPVLLVFFLCSALTLGLGMRFFAGGKGAILFSAASAGLFVSGILAVISFISLYIYELPTHHCPFCILRSEYHSIGYAIYLSLLSGVVAGMTAGVLEPAGKRDSLKTIVPSLQQKLVTAAMLAFGTFLIIAIYGVLFSAFRLVK